jgi:alpha-tubulin suppressor-like RCC1 family protein
MRALVMVIGLSLLVFGGASPAAGAGPGVAAMSTGEYHACAARTDGTVWCWGDAQNGRVGDGTTGDVDHLRSTPVQVRRGSSTLTGVTRLAGGGEHTCALRANGTVWCWGDASLGQLGNGQSGGGAYRTRAVQVRRGSGDLTRVERIAAGLSHSCAVRTDGTVWCWGYAEFGQLGDGTTGDGSHVRATAVRVRRGSGSLDRVVAVTVGALHTCALRKDGSVWCWGAGQYGQLGDGVSGAGHLRTRATRVKHGTGYLAKASGIVAGDSHTCVRRTNGTAWCWGLGQYGQLGDGTTGNGANIRSKPVQVRHGSGFLTGVTSVGAGVTHTCARRSDGSAWCWGHAVYGQLGDGTTGDPTDHVRLRPVRVRRSSGSFTGMRQMDGGVGFSCALRTDKSVWCWGYNGNSQLGRGTADDDPHPHPLKVTFP